MGFSGFTRQWQELLFTVYPPAPCISSLIREKALGGPRRAIYLIFRLHRAHSERLPPCLTRANVSVLHVGRALSQWTLPGGGGCLHRGTLTPLPQVVAELENLQAHHCVASRVEQSMVGKLDMGLLERGGE